MFSVDPLFQRFTGKVCGSWFELSRRFAEPLCQSIRHSRIFKHRLGYDAKRYLLFESRRKIIRVPEGSIIIATNTNANTHRLLVIEDDVDGDNPAKRRCKRLCGPKVTPTAIDVCKNPKPFPDVFATKTRKTHSSIQRDIQREHRQYTQDRVGSCLFSACWC